MKHPSLLLAGLLLAGTGLAVETSLSSLDLSKIKQGWGVAQRDQAVTEKPMSIGGTVFKTGFGTHAPAMIVVELDDWEFDIELSGPVKRLLCSGAAAYVLADSIDELAAKITARPHEPSGESDPAAIHELTSASTVDDLVAAFLGESAAHSTLRQRDNP